MRTRNPAATIFEGFRERSTSFSLGYLAIGLLAGSGTRRRNVLRRAGYAWTPDLGVFDNSKRYDFLPTCVLLPFLRVFPCFGCFEAVRGRLIGPKTWDRVVRIFLGFLRGRDCPENLWTVWVSLILEFLS